MNISRMCARDNFNSSFGYNKKNKLDGLTLLKVIPDNSIPLVFFDPQYRGILDHQKYGNEGKGRGKARSELPQMSYDLINEFMNEIQRVIIPTGHLMLWIDKFQLVTGVSQYASCGLQTIDLITWNKMKMGMGYRTRRQAEYLLILQKPPIRAKDVWTLHNIPDVWDEKVYKVHPHSKPISLQKNLIWATTTKGDTVLDPCAGGYSVLEACKQSNRNFIGCDIKFGEEDVT